VVTDDPLDVTILRAIRRLGDRASTRTVGAEVRRSHTTVRHAWDRLAARGLCPPIRHEYGPRPGTVMPACEPPTEEEIAERAAFERSLWAADDPRLLSRWEVPSGRLLLEADR
jgi:hypothetical protein